ncbi:uncharacterized protein [Anomalospiza imberbis]|uniref:uncharacterized protein n=1 Tax=Anomalospiza imberbis TaxID=187417 RepID=UPI00358EFF57
MSGGCVTRRSSHFNKHFKTSRLQHTSTSSSTHFKKLYFKDTSSGSLHTKTCCLTDTSSVSHIALRGEAHFPNLQIQPSTLAFAGGTEEVRSLEMTSCSSLPVKYRWSLRPVDKLGYELYPPKFKPQPPKEQRTSLDCSAYKRRFKIRKEEAGRAMKEVQDFAQSLGAEGDSGCVWGIGPSGYSCTLLQDALLHPCPCSTPQSLLSSIQAFSILPLSGVLQPGQSQKVSFSFSGHRDALGSVKALCHVEGGPTYEVGLIASRVSYSLSLQEINCGSQMFNEIGHSTVTLENTGRIEFKWVLNPSPASQHLPGVFLVKPTTGSIAPGEKQVLKFSYMPGLPGAFSRIYQLKVGDLDPKNILLKGEASFPMITVNLPWNAKENEKDEKPLKQHVKHLQQYSQRNKSKVVQKIQSLKTETLKSQTLTTQTPKTQTSVTRDPKTQDLKLRVLGSGTVPSPQLQVNTVRMLIEKAALELQKKLTCHPPKSRFPDKQLCQSLVKVELPEYVLDMGTVLKGFTGRSTLEISNPGQMPVSFQVDESVLQDTGFSVDLGLMKSLPPSHTTTFDVCFESARWPQGDVDVLLPIEVTKGPTSHIRLRATVLEVPRVVFPQWRKTMKEDEVIFKEYVESTKRFHFGPLLCGKSREWYKAKNCPGNSENLTILNNSPADIEVQFSFENAGGAETFLLDPPSMALKPKEKQELTIWAYPTSPGFLEDKLICSIGENSDPVVFSLCCHGVHVKLEVSPLELSFDKLFRYRTDSRTLLLRNNTLLPVAWQLSGLDDVEGFSLSQDNGTIDPRSEFEVTVHFEAGQIGIIEKTLRLEVSDTENILGVVQAENIKISAEVYDVSLSIEMPEAPDGSLEFGTINVRDNAKKVVILTNEGVYNVGYSFTVKGAGPRMQNLASYFTVEPQSGMLTASQPSVNIEMLFHPKSEIVLKNKPILYCQVIDASSGGRGQALADVPVRVSAKAVYSKYSIEPASPIDFGAVIKGTKKTQTVVLENKGMLSFKFRIRRAPKEASALESKR